MPAIERSKAPVRPQNLHIQLTDEEAHKIRMVHAASGSKRIGVWARELLMPVIKSRFEELKTNGMGEVATAGGR